MTEAAVARIGESVDELCDELDLILSRVIRNDAVLYLERESDKWHTVTDVANHNEIMLRAELDVCVRFMEAFVVRHPGSRVDLDALAIARGAAELRQQFAQVLAGDPPSAVEVHSPAAPAEHSVHVDFMEGGAIVIPIRGQA